jgi:hypothetical protein
MLLAGLYKTVAMASSSFVASISLWACYISTIKIAERVLGLHSKYIAPGTLHILQDWLWAWFLFYFLF